MSKTVQESNDFLVCTAKIRVIEIQFVYSYQITAGGDVPVQFSEILGHLRVRTARTIQLNLHRTVIARVTLVITDLQL